MTERPEAAPGRRRRGLGPPVAAFVGCVLVFSFATSAALDGIPNTETGLFSAMAAVAGLPVAGITVVAPALLLVARLAGIGIVIAFVVVLVTRKRLGRPGRQP